METTSFEQAAMAFTLHKLLLLNGEVKELKDSHLELSEKLEQQTGVLREQLEQQTGALREQLEQQMGALREQVETIKDGLQQLISLLKAKDS